MLGRVQEHMRLLMGAPGTEQAPARDAHACSRDWEVGQEVLAVKANWAA